MNEQQKKLKQEGRDSSCRGNEGARDSAQK